MPADSLPRVHVPDQFLPVPQVTVVTGAAGWLGQALVARLAADPARERLRLLVRSIAEQRLLAERHADRPGVEIVVGDISRADTARRLLHEIGHDAHVLHTAGIIHPRRIREFVEVNAHGSRHIAEAALDHGVQRAVHVSSNSPFGTNPDPLDVFRADEPYNPYLGYGRSKMHAELAVLDAHRRGLDAVIVRPPWFYGPYQPARQTSFFRLVRGGKFPVIGAGEQRRSMVFVENLVDGILAASLTPGVGGRGYWIADSRPYTVNEIVDTVGRALSAEGFEVTPNSTRLPAVAARIAETGDRVLQTLGLYQQQLHVLGEMGHTIACDISAATTDLGYRPTVELFDGMRRSIRWCIDQGLEL
jgi:nucleoside-diphosphate-sugar epimerase